MSDILERKRKAINDILEDASKLKENTDKIIQERDILVQKVNSAAAKGDLRENEEYVQAQANLAAKELEMSKLEEIKAAYDKIIQVKDEKHEIVSIGAYVVFDYVIKNSYTVKTYEMLFVPEGLGSTKLNRLAENSLVGEALKGHTVGLSEISFRNREGDEISLNIKEVR